MDGMPEERQLDRHERRLERRDREAPRNDKRCYGRSKAGHLVTRYPNTLCFNCGTIGHVLRHCLYLYKSKEAAEM